MRPLQRHGEIITLLNHSDEMTVEELADRLQVSRETIRRDLSKLDAIGRLKKFHGGARVSITANEPFKKEGPFAIRMAENSAEKKKIAIAAARLLQPDDTIFINTGSTTVAFAKELAKLQSLLIITNSHQIAAEVSANASHKIFLVGGAYGADAGESLGPLALEQIAKFRARYAILTVGALDTYSAMDFDLQEAEISKAMINRSDKVIVVADHSKFDKQAVFEVTSISTIDIVVTDRPLPAQVSTAFSNANIEIVIS